MSEKWPSIEGLSDKDINLVFWKAVNIAKTKGIEKAVEYAGDSIYLFSNIASKLLRPRAHYVPLESVSKPTLAYLVMMMFVKAKCDKCLSDFLRDTSENTAVMVAAIRVLIEDKEAVSMFKKMIKSPDTVLSVLDVLENAPDAVLNEFLPELKNIAKNDIDVRQHRALQILSYFVDKDKEVRRIFLSFIDDWDPDVRRIVIRSFMHSAVDEEVVKRAKYALRNEDEKELKSMLKRIIRVKNERGDSKDTKGKVASVDRKERGDKKAD